MKLTYGAHLSPGDTKYLYGVIDSCDCRAVQVFISNPRSFNATLADKSRKIIEELVFERKMTVCAHMPYVVNLASKDESLRQKSVEHVIAAISASSELEIAYYVVHSGSGETEALADSIAAIMPEIKGKHTKLLIENTEGSGSKLLCDAGEALEFIEKYGRGAGICWDTAHAFGGGVDTLELSDRFKSHVKLVHLNDSKAAFNSKKDRHDSFSSGMIGKAVISKIVKHFGDGPIYIIEREGFENTCADLLFLKKMQK